MNYNELDGEILCTTCHRRHGAQNTATLTTNATATATTASTTAAAADDDDDDDDDDATSQSLPHAVKQHDCMTQWLVWLTHGLVEDRAFCPVVQLL